MLIGSYMDEESLNSLKRGSQRKPPKPVYSVGVPILITSQSAFRNKERILFFSMAMYSKVFSNSTICLTAIKSTGI